jgi:SHS2 domain-containing protein
MLEVMTELGKVAPEIEDSVEVEGEDEYSLLYSWLEAILVKIEVNQMLYSKFKIVSIGETRGGLRLKAKIWGEPFNPEKHPQKVGVKAITYHRMEIIKETDNIVAKFILDI